MILTERSNKCSLWGDIENITLNSRGKAVKSVVTPEETTQLYVAKVRVNWTKAEVPSYKIEY